MIDSLKIFAEWVAFDGHTVLKYHLRLCQRQGIAFNRVAVIREAHTKIVMETLYRVP